MSAVFAVGSQCRFLVGCALVLLSAYVGAQDQPVTVIRVAKVETADGRSLLSIDYRYAFPGQESVYVEYFGDVASSGELSHLVSSGQLRFFDARNGHLLQALRLTATVSTQAPARAIEMPQLSQFPQPFRAATWTSNRFFMDAVQDVANRWFVYVPLSYQNVDALMTNFAPLEGAPSSADAQIALLLTHPFDSKGRSVSYHLQYIVRERPIRSRAWSEELTSETRAAAQNFVSDFMKLVAQKQE